MPSSKLTLSSEVKYLKGVGPVRAELLAARDIRTVEDLLYYTPFRYEDRTRITPVRDLVPGQTATILAENALLLAGGLAIGAGCAAIAVLPALGSHGGGLLTVSMAGWLGAILTTGLAAAFLATLVMIRRPLIPALRAE